MAIDQATKGAVKLASTIFFIGFGLGVIFTAVISVVLWAIGTR